MSAVSVALASMEPVDEPTLRREHRETLKAVAEANRASRNALRVALKAQALDELYHERLAGNRRRAK